MDCYFRIDNDRYTLGNRYIERTWQYDGQNFYTVSLLDRTTGRQWVEGGIEPFDEISYEGLTNNIRDKAKHYGMKLLNVGTIEETGSLYSGPNLEVIFNFTDELHGVHIRRHAIIYEAAPAIRTFIEVKSINLPMGGFFSAPRLNILDSYPAVSGEAGLDSFEFFTRTDQTNHLIEERHEPRDDGSNQQSRLANIATAKTYSYE